ncbi:DUF192 domain-containing protein [Desertimonas flava]|uniref:DUF192 domain-containing protein n=1 Tax=Desertimonas flava TaxID=2064846 RepID=UPI000E351A86|nr:DUF192 domain-containing protein [Desertimonas flava]
MIPGRLTGGAEEAVGLCFWLADTPALQQRGLMGVTDLGGADGMLFVFDGPTTAAFYMWQTPLPLSVSFFDADGRLVDGAEMAPCLDESPGSCERYHSEVPYVMALEVVSGSWRELLVPGAVLTVEWPACDGMVPTDAGLKRGGRCEGVVVGAPPASTPAQHSHDERRTQRS